MFLHQLVPGCGRTQETNTTLGDSSQGNCEEDVWELFDKSTLSIQKNESFGFEEKSVWHITPFTANTFYFSFCED